MIPSLDLEWPAGRSTSSLGPWPRSAPLPSPHSPSFRLHHSSFQQRQPIIIAATSKPRSRVVFFVPSSTCLSRSHILGKDYCPAQTHNAAGIDNLIQIFPGERKGTRPSLSSSTTSLKLKFDMHLNKFHVSSTLTTN